MSLPDVIMGRRTSGVVIVCTALCAGCQSPTSPTSGPEPTPSIAVVIQGRVLDVDDQGPVAGAVIATANVGVSGSFRTLDPQALTTADGNGDFALSANVPADWTALTLKASRDGFEAAMEVYVERSTGTAPALTLSRTITLVTGRSLDVHLGQTSLCGDDEPCRRVVVQSDTPVEVALTPLAQQRTVGLSLTPTFYVATHQQRVTVSQSEVWIVGEPGPVRLTARRP